jgi:Family of unknown function (DUF6516)
VRPKIYDDLAGIALAEFGDIVTGHQLFYRRATAPLKLRLFIRDGTTVDVWVDPTANRYSFHWEQSAVRGLIHRHDNAPDNPEISTFPKHFHDGRRTSCFPA